MMMKFYDFTIHGKLMNPMKLESNDFYLRSRRNPCFKIRKNLNQIWANMKNKTTLMIKLTL